MKMYRPDILGFLLRHQHEAEQKVSAKNLLTLTKTKFENGVRSNIKMTAPKRSRTPTVIMKDLKICKILANDSYSLLNFPNQAKLFLINIT